VVHVNFSLSMNASNMISVVSPVYQSAECIDKLVSLLIETLSSISPHFEIILVNDGSSDASWDIILCQSDQDTRVKGINLSRNFGQHAAITAGLKAASGEWVVVMDCDLQDDPREIGRLYEKAKEGYDAVVAQRVFRSDPWHKKMLSTLFYKTLSFLTGIKQDAAAANFGIYHKKMIQSILKMNESARFFPAMVNWVGFKISRLPVHHQPRFQGESTYTLYRRFKLALDIMLAYSDKPLRLIMYLGFFISFMSFLFAVWIFVHALLGTITLLGYSSLIVTVSFLSGIIISVLGIIGLYVGKIFEGIKKRPMYLIKDTTYDFHSIQ